MIRENPRPIRVALAIVAIAACLYLIQSSARIGFSRLLSRYALIADSTAAADAAIRLSPSDPDAHRARATVFTRLRTPGEAVKSLEAATSLRPREDNLWLELGNAREELGDAAGALAAFDQAVRWAPYYGHTHWQRGNLLLRMGRYGEAFGELRTAASIDPRYFSNLVDLAWGVSGGNAELTSDLIQTNNDRERLAFVFFLAKKGKANEIRDQLPSFSTPVSKDDRRELVRLLSAAKTFRDSYYLWFDDDEIQAPTLFNGGFEEPLVYDGLGLGGWAVLNQHGKTKLAIDVSEKFDGAKSLQITLDGDWTPEMALLSQTILVEPSSTYRIYFFVKTKDLVTGGPPLFTVSDASTNELLGKSQNFPSATTDWTRLIFEFTTPAKAEAAVIRLQRNNCEPAPCPIFGVLWLDEITTVYLQVPK